MRTRIKNVLMRMHLYNFAVRIRDALRSVRFLRNNIKMWRCGSPDGIAIPPLELIGLVAGPQDIQWFLEGGRLACESIKEILNKNEIQIESLKSILDFGCGCGRAIRYFTVLTDKTSLYGVDYNSKLIEWCTHNLKFANFKTNNIEPPLNFSDASIELIYSLSVFTHMPEDLQLKWIDELKRVLKPGGLLIISTHGERYQSIFTPEENDLFNAGELVLRKSGKVGSNSYGAYHPVDYVKTKLCKHFSFVDFIAEGAKGNPHQDLFLFRKVG